MNRIIIKLIKIYQNTPTRIHKQCKYAPTCSNYAIGVYSQYNFFIASFYTVKRILKCNPWSKGGYDPIPNKKEVK